ncbi:50S ribosomal protein L29 [Peijinzhouia sedimentorum]|jgi:large subunit ribosomal protein L29|tara:strand:+ start:434 stop:628 length:195 start_codon:yes stop_codon:yes gene_type:complete
MKNAEIISLSQEELAEKIAVEVENLQKLKFAHAISPLENPMKIREAKKLIARLKTEETSRNLSN